MKKRFVFLLFLFTNTLVFSQECGALMAPLSIQDRANEATFVVEGKVTSSNSYWDVEKKNIYTVHSIIVYKNFKGQTHTTFKVVTMGGKVGGNFQLTSSAANLQEGMTGVFFLKDFRSRIAISDNLYELVGAAQGVIKYDKYANNATDIFNKYSSVEDEVYPAIKRATGTTEKILQERATANRNMASRANPIIYSFSPLTATAGTQTVLTITGNNFGSTMGTMSFSNANDGGATFTQAADTEILSWSNTLIEVEIPYLAGTGVLQITHSDESTHETTVPLTITYSHNNLDNSGTILSLALQDDDGNGGYTFEYHTDFNSSSAKTYFEEAFGLWNCESNINFSFGNTTTTDESVSDGINIVRFDNGSELASGVLGSVTTRFTTYCGTTNRVLVDEMDITWNDDTNWHYGSGAPSASEYDFKTVALHELGHAHQLGHVIDSDVIMHYSLGAGDEKYVLDQNDIDGAIYTMDIFTESIGCGNTAMSENIQCCDAITISSQPSDLELAEGATGQFSVNASNYIDALWFSSSDGNSWSVLSDGTDYSGTTTTTLTINSANLSDNNKFFRVFLENECGEFINSDNATLTVIEYTTIPDANFEAALEALGYDNISGDGQIPTDNINTVTSLDLDNANISDLTGIEDFAALESLDADNNSLSSIDVSALSNLSTLRLDYNNLTSIDVTNNTSLEVLSFRNNALTNIDVSNNLDLKTLHFQFNDVNTLDLTNNIALIGLICRGNDLTSLDLSQNTALTNVWAGDNFITSMDLTNNTVLTVVHLYNNELTSLDLRNGNNSIISNFSLVNNENLDCILVSDLAFAQANWSGGIDDHTSFNDVSCTAYTAIPDANFEARLEELGYDDISGDGKVPTANIETVTFLAVGNENISDVTGIEDFTALTTLNCSNNSLTNLDISANVNLTNLNCNDNSLTSLDLTTNLLLDTLSASNNQLSSLDVTNNIQLIEISIRTNQLATIDLSANLLLESLDITSNSFSSIDISNNTALINLTVFGNTLTSLNVNNNTVLEYLDFGENPITSIDISNNLAITEIYAYYASLTGSLDLRNHISLTDLDVTNNDLSSLDLRNGNNANFLYFDATGNSSLTCILVDDATYSTSNWLNIDVGQSFTETDYCRYTVIPDANFEARLEALGYDDISSDGQVPTALIEVITTLNVNNQGITDVTGIEDFMALTTLSCRGNNFTSLDISQNLLLETLTANNNDLTSIDVSNNVMLKNLNLGANNLTTLNVSNNTALETLSLQSNSGLTSIDISNNILLKELRIYNTNIMTLDLSVHPDLETLYAYNSALTTIDVSNNSVLQELRVNNTSVSELDVSNNPNIISLRINGTSIETLDLSSQTTFQNLFAQNTSLSYLNVKNGNNTNVGTFRIENNPNLNCVVVDDASYSTTNWTSIDNQTSFSDTYCRYTAIPDANFEARLESVIADDVSGDGQVPTALIEVITNLDASNRSITDLTGVEDFKALQKLNVSRNDLTSLNLSNNTNLEELNISDNTNFTSLDVSSCLLLERINAEANKFSSLDLSANTQLDALFVTDNDVFSEIDLSVNTSLRVLTLNNLDNLAAVDLHQNALIDSLEVKENLILSEFNVQNGTNTDILYFQGNNNNSLTCILVDDAAYSTTNWTNVDVTTTFSETSCPEDYTLAIDVFLQGALLNPNTGEENLMRDDLRVAGYIPTSSPYADALACESTVFNTTGDNAIVDWIFVELRDATDNTVVSYSRSALVQRDGDVVDVDGSSDLILSLDDDTYYVVVQHRNHLSIMTSTAVTLNSESVYNINFTDATLDITYGTDAQTTSGMPDSIYAMWAGDCNNDNNVQYSGTSPDTPDILSAVLNDAGNFLNFPTYSITDYNVNDVNMDGVIQYSGTNPDTPFILQNVLAHPSNFLNFSTYQITQQIPE